MDVRDLLADAAQPTPGVPVGGLDRAMRRGAQLRRRRLTVMTAAPTAIVAVVALLAVTLGAPGDAHQRVRTVPANRPPGGGPVGSTVPPPVGSGPTSPSGDHGASKSGASAKPGISRPGNNTDSGPGPAGPESMGGTWRLTGSMSTPRYAHTATLLPSGKVLVAGGAVPTTGDQTASAATAELYDPATGRWGTTGSMSVARAAHTATLLPNGKVLVTGGDPASGTTLPGTTATAELYDPATGTWSATGSMTFPRSFHTATLLSSGKVLVAGGAVGGPAYGGAQQGGATATAEVYDPGTGTWSTTASMASARYAFTATLLPNGTVLVAGGWTGSAPTADAELYDPATGTWRSAGSMATPKENHTATLLPGGTVLVAGGFTGPGTTSDAELYDPATGWRPTRRLLEWRENATATLLISGKVLVAGGDPCCGGSHLAEAELYDPSTGRTSTGSMSTARDLATATLLRNGQVLIAGGGVASAELYEEARPR